MKIEGFILIKKDAKFDSIWIHYGLEGGIWPVELFGTPTDGVLIYVRNYNVSIRVQQKHIQSSFRCTDEAEILLPPDITEFEKTTYMARISKQRDMGNDYTEATRQQIIRESLLKGTFTDAFYFNEVQKER